jgi:hypothetical protein
MMYQKSGLRQKCSTESTASSQSLGGEVDPEFICLLLFYSKTDTTSNWCSSKYKHLKSLCIQTKGKKVTKHISDGEEET